MHTIFITTEDNFQVELWRYGNELKIMPLLLLMFAGGGDEAAAATYVQFNFNVYVVEVNAC